MTFQKFLWSEAQATILSMHQGPLSKLGKITESTGLREGSKLRIPVSNPLQSSHGTQACSGSRYGKQHMSGKSEGIK